MSARVSGGGAKSRNEQAETAHSVNTLFRLRAPPAAPPHPSLTPPRRPPASKMVKEMRGLQTFIADIREGTPRTLAKLKIQ